MAPAQTTFNNQMAPALEGQLADGSQWKDRITAIVNMRQLFRVLIVTAVNSEEYVVTINGTDFDITSDSSATKPEITAALKVDIDAGSEPVEVTDDLADTLLIEAAADDTDEITLSTSADTPSAISDTEPITYQASLPFGRLVVQASGGDDMGSLPHETAEISGGKDLGFSLRDQTQPIVRGATVAAYPPGSAVPLVRRGRVYVEVEDAVVQGGEVFIRFLVSGVNVDLGKCRSDADSSTAVALPGASYRTSVSAGELAIVDYNAL